MQGELERALERLYGTAVQAAGPAAPTPASTPPARLRTSTRPARSRPRAYVRPSTPCSSPTSASCPRRPCHPGSTPGARPAASAIAIAWPGVRRSTRGTRCGRCPAAPVSRPRPGRRDPRARGRRARLRGVRSLRPQRDRPARHGSRSSPRRGSRSAGGMRHRGRGRRLPARHGAPNRRRPPRGRTRRQPIELVHGPPRRPSTRPPAPTAPAHGLTLERVLY